mgnify:CR=1 FL=1
MNRFASKITRQGLVIVLCLVLAALSAAVAYGKYVANDTVTNSLSLNVTSKKYILETGPNFKSHMGSKASGAVKCIFGKKSDYPDIVAAYGSKSQIVDEAKKGTIKLYFDSTNKIAYVLSEGKILANPDCRQMFMNLSITEIQPDNISTELTTNMSYMFSKSKIPELDVSWLNTSNVTDMSYMFETAVTTSLDMSVFDTSKVVTMEGMFTSSKVPALSIPENFDTSNVTNMSKMFEYANCTSINFPSSFNTSNVTDMSYMFNYAKYVTAFDLSTFRTENVTSMKYMFGRVTVTTLDLNTFSNASLKDCSYMFYECSKLINLYLCGFSTTSSMNVTYMMSDWNLMGDHYSYVYTLPGVSFRGCTDGGYGIFYRSWIRGNIHDASQWGYHVEYAVQNNDGYFRACKNPNHSHANTTSLFSVNLDTSGLGNMTASQAD